MVWFKYITRMQSKFQIGDRVAVYGATNVYQRATGVVKKILADFHLVVTYDVPFQDHAQKQYVHPKQCRRLVRKKRAEIFLIMSDDGWVYAKGGSGNYIKLLFKDAPPGNWKRFVEAKHQ